MDESNENKRWWQVIGITTLIMVIYYGYSRNKTIRKTVNGFIVLILILAIIGYFMPSQSETDISSDYFEGMKKQ